MGPDELLGMVAGILDRLDIPYYVTGSMASMAYGEPRLTNDIDMVVLMEEGHVSNFTSAFPESEFYVSEEAVREAVRGRDMFNVIHPASGLKVDFMVREEEGVQALRFSRARILRPSEEYEARFASPEDVILSKMEFYAAGGSDKHLRDIAGVLRVSAGELDLEYIDEWSARLGLDEVWNAIKSP